MIDQQGHTSVSISVRYSSSYFLFFEPYLGVRGELIMELFCAENANKVNPS